MRRLEGRDDLVRLTDIVVVLLVSGAIVRVTYEVLFLLFK